MATRYEWDSNKNRANRAKHGISFETALLVFADPFVLLRRDREVNGEERWHAIGYVHSVLTVTHTSVSAGSDEVIRIISARPATNEERRAYEQQEE